MFITPGALELIRVFLGGEEPRPWTAESTFWRGSDMMAIGVAEVLEVLREGKLLCLDKNWSLSSGLW